jgi:enoyl-CoA hydratase/carnithine racemase
MAKSEEQEVMDALRELIKSGLVDFVVNDGEREYFAVGSDLDPRKDEPERAEIFRRGQRACQATGNDGGVT